MPARAKCPTCLAPAGHLGGGTWRCRLGHVWKGAEPVDTPAVKRAALPRQRGRCKDCTDQGIVADRPAPHPGPRCHTHHNDHRRALRLRSKERHVQRTYSLSPEEYDAMLASQGGKCAICRRATGASKRLAVDHDHACCIGPVSCGKCVRGLVCSVCNDVLAHFRDVPDTFERAAAYLRAWPSGRGPTAKPRLRGKMST